MTRLTALCAAALLTLGLLTGCGRKGGEAGELPKLDPSNPVSLEIWHYYNGPQKTAFDQMVREFNETEGQKRGIIVEAFSQGNVNELIAKVLDAANQKVGAGDVPDVFAAYADTAYEVDQMGLLADLSPYLSEETLSQYRAEFIEEGRFAGDGSLKIFPIAKSVELFMINLTDWNKFAAATGADLKELSTVEGITGAAAAYYAWTDSLTPEPDDGKAFFGRDAMANYFVIGCRQMGVEIFDVGEDGTVTIRADRDIIRKLWDNYYVPFVNGYFSADGRFRSDGAHMGSLISLVGSSSGALYFPTEVAITDFESYPIDCAVFPAPIFQDGEPFAVQQGAGMCVTKSAPRTEYAAAVFLQWFTEAERNVEFSVGSGYLPVKNEALDMALISPALDRLESESDGARIKQTLSAALDMLSESTLYTTRAFERGNACRNVLEYSLSDQAAADRQAVEELMAQGVSRQEAVARFDTDENFEAWYTQFLSQLSSSLEGA